MLCQIQLNENVPYVLYMCEINYTEKYEHGKNSSSVCFYYEVTFSTYYH